MTAAASRPDPPATSAPVNVPGQSPPGYDSRLLYEAKPLKTHPMQQPSNRTIIDGTADQAAIFAASSGYVAVFMYAAYCSSHF
jgi:hypothetical protein